MSIEKFAFYLTEELCAEKNPIKVAEKINSCNLSNEDKRKIISFIKYYINKYYIEDYNKYKNYSDNSSFLDLVSEVKRRVIGDN